MYAKLVNGELRGAPNPLKIDDKDVFTNDPSLFLQCGYKPVTLTDYPSDGNIYENSWEEKENEIVQIWTKIETTNISDSEALSIITEGTS
jgi:hypothetical protein